MTVDLCSLDTGDTVVLRSGAIFQVAQLIIDISDRYPVFVKNVVGDTYLMNGRCWEDRESLNDIVEVIKNPKRLRLIDIVREVMK